MDNEKKLLKDCYNKAMIAAEGRVVITESETEIKHILQNIADLTGCILSGAELYDLAKPYTSDNETIYGLSCSTVHGYNCVNLILRKKNAPFCIDDKHGVLCYVPNLTAPDCSELGRCWFEKTDDGYHRIA